MVDLCKHALQKANPVYNCSLFHKLFDKTWKILLKNKTILLAQLLFALEVGLVSLDTKV